MLHRDPSSSSMTTACIVQRIARQALATFTGPCPGHGASFLDNHGKLRSLMNQLRAKDLSLVPRKGDGRPAGSAVHPFHGAAPVTYMHICETEDFSMGVFLLTKGASIPLHDHPGMHGLLRVVYGTARITCFDRTDTASQPGASASSSSTEPPPTSLFQRGALRRSALRSTGEYTEDSPPCVLSPHANNLHQIDAVDGPTAFLDVLAPPYEPDDGRDCHYYKVLPAPPSASSVQAGCGVAGSEGQDRQQQEDKEVWLMEISQPSDFWCGSEQYPGPHVTL